MRAAATISFLLVAGACGDEGTAVRSGPPQQPTGGEDVVIQVVVEGGFVPAEVALGTVPVATVLGDGTVITPAPVPAIYPGPAITPLQAAQAAPAAVDALIERARTLGLLGPELEYGRPPVADAPTTTVTIAADATTYRQSAYALGITDDEPARRGVPGLSEEEVENRRRLRQFVDAVSELPPGDRAWTPGAVAVYDLGPYRPEPELPQTPAPWPLPQEPATGSQHACTLIEGDDVSVLLAALEEANARTPWIVDGSLRSLAFRPVVPGQPGCPA